ncbi:hypothetical protein D9M69_553480 [compost metagenome]
MSIWLAMALKRRAASSNDGMPGTGWTMSPRWMANAGAGFRRAISAKTCRARALARALVANGEAQVSSDSLTCVSATTAKLNRRAPNGCLENCGSVMIAAFLISINGIQI